MRDLIGGVIGSHPLAQRSRLITLPAIPPGFA